MKILVAIDDTESSQDAISFTNELFGADPDQFEILVFHVAHSAAPFAFVADPISGGIIYPTAIPSVMKAQAEIDADEERAAAILAAGIDGDNEVMIGHGNAGLAICNVVETEAIELVVVGTRDRSAWSRLWHRSVSEYVARNAACPVLIVR